MAVGDHGRARVMWRPPEQRRFGTGGMPGMLSMLLLALVLFLGGIAIGRATTIRGQAAVAAPPVTTAASASTAAPTASTVAAAPGTAVADPQARGAATSRVGPRRVVHGVGVGYARTQQGAVAAAANFTRVLSSSLILDDGKRRLAIATLAAPEARTRLQRTFDQAVDSLRKGLGVTGADDGTQVLLRATPVGWRVEEYGGGTARVAIWATSVSGSLGGAQGPVPIREGWGTTTVDLRWVKDDWKQLDTTTAEGPVPIADVAPPTAAAELVTKASEFKEFTYAPGS
ncbi:MAG TPA: hypothetical protein VGS14_01645 [Actinomycetes bacterium]|jgi:hypothetical protein|nr:hypothetical protein [Actinomycetes bacterium]